MDLSEFEPDRDKRCKVASLDLSPEQREKLNEAFQSGYTTYAIRKVLNNKWGFKIAAQTIDKHRSGSCGCFNE